MAMMTVSAVLSQVDDLLPNGYTKEEKCRWVTQAEGFVRAEVYGLDASTMGQLGEEDTLCAEYIAAQLGEFRPQVWASIPAINAILLYLAFRGILRDEMLVRSLDRLR